MYPPLVGDRLGRLLGGLHLDLARGDHRRTVFLAGTGRSGTTWLSGLVNHDRLYRNVFEPFHPGKVGALRGFRSKQYLRPDDRREEFLYPARRVLSGEVRSFWTDRGGALLARRRLVKDVRANLMLGWMADNFPGMPIVLLVRHPGAVVSSRLALEWRDNLDETMEQKELVEDHLLPMEAEILASTEPFERHLFLWCIDNYVPLKQFRPGGLHLCFYENLLLDPETELRRLFGFIGRDFDEGVLRRIGRPSPTSRRETRGDHDAEGWGRGTTGRQLERASEILGLFGLDRVYGEGATPDPSGARALMATGSA
ncbi:sulfotransferase [Rubrobacter tropicus]|uniref:sulfotransferase n=1 Tax=Rubrobacter tropicus TaxID=2653851 RepID=UPI001407E88A|nr:sulfotransferase [Rubrobacter tropicus]